MVKFEELEVGATFKDTSENSLNPNIVYTVKYIEDSEDKNARKENEEAVKGLALVNENNEHYSKVILKGSDKTTFTLEEFREMTSNTYNDFEQI